MPSRIIREGWIESEAVDKLTVHAERFFIRLCLKADDYGRYHANPQLLRSNLFPLKIDLRATDIAQWLTECEAVGLVRCYERDQKRFMEIVKFKQRVRSPISKFPPCDGHTTDKCPTCGGNPPPYSELESESETNAKSETESNPNPAGGGMSVGLRIGAWFKRRPTTVWSPKEKKALALIETANPPAEDIALLEAYYTAPATAFPVDRDYRRRDIVTLLNNWNGEVDRARRWKSNPQSPTQTDHSQGF